MPLPRFIVLKSNYNERYLGYVPPDEFKEIDQGVERSRNSFLRFDRNEVSTTFTKFEVEPANIGDGSLVHLKSCYNNKYWVRWSPRHWWIVAAAEQPEEDRSKWSCTLFKPVYIDQNVNTVRFIHFQLGHYACLWRIDRPFGDCLFGGSKDPDQYSCDVVTVIDWESLSTSTSRPGGSGAATSLPRNSLNAIAFIKGYHFGVNGTIEFSQDLNSVTITATIKNITFGYQYALHIKTYGDISRGSFSSEPTFRDLGNFEFDQTGTLERREINQEEISLIDEDSIIGRTIVLYSISNSKLGKPLAWGVIGYKFCYM